MSIHVRGHVRKIIYNILYLGILFTGRGKAVLDENGDEIQQCNGQVRVGRGFAESTFRKIYHPLHTLHVHFQQESEYKV